MIYRPVRERDPAGDRRHGGQRGEKERLRRGQPHVAVDRRLLVHRAAREEGGGRARAEAGLARRLALRAYGLDENVLDDIARVRATGVTFAPEAGTQRMRDVINKNVTEEQLLETAERVFSRGWKAMKLYFMIGLPTEEEEDVREIPRVGGRARAIGKRVKKELGAPGAPKVDGERLDARAQAAHAISVVRDGHAGGRPREAELARARSAHRGRRAQDARLGDVVARGRLRARRSAARRRARARLPRRARASTRGKTRRRWTSGRRPSAPRASSRRSTSARSR